MELKRQQNSCWGSFLLELNASIEWKTSMQTQVFIEAVFEMTVCEVQLTLMVSFC